MDRMLPRAGGNLTFSGPDHNVTFRAYLTFPQRPSLPGRRFAVIGHLYW